MTQICRLISTSTVRPPQLENDYFTSRIELTPFDLLALFVNQNQRGLLFHKPTETHFGNFIQHLKDTISHTLALFFPLAGRLSKVFNTDDVKNDTVSFFLECNHAGATFIHAVADGISVSDVLEPISVPDDVVYSFFPANGLLNHEGVSKPLLAVQVTELLDGVFIACTMNHAAGDGSSFWHFLNTWSEISRNQNSASVVQVPPVFSRNYLHGVIDLPIRMPCSFVPIAIPQFAPPPLQQRVFHFRKDKIAQLKAKANAELGTNKISSLQALMAHLWISITRSRRLNADEQVQYNLLVGMRSRMEPPLPEAYLGNAVLFGEVKSLAGQLLDKGLGSAAQEINKVIASKTKEEVWRFLEDWSKNPRLKIYGQSPRNMLLMASSPRFDVYGNDFGWGRPIAVRSGPGNKFDGKLTVFAGAEEGSIDFEACLLPQTIDALADDVEFMQILA